MKNKIFNKKIIQSFNNSGVLLHKIYTIFGLKFKFSVQEFNKSHVNKYLRNISPYKVVPHAIWDAENKQEILKLDWNEATIQPTPLVKQCLTELMDKADFFNIYPKTKNDNLLDLISKYTDLPNENIQYFASSDSIHEYIAKMYIREGDKVLIQGPSYDNFRLTVQANGGDIYYSEANKDFEFDGEKFEEDIKDIKPTFVYIINPNNPTGHKHSVEYIENIVQNHQETMFLIDEAYFEFSGITCAQLVRKYENILITRTLSKAFALANFRFGYLIGSKENIKSITNIRNPKNISTYTQSAATAALLDIDYMEKYVKEVNDAKKYFQQEMQQFAPMIKTYESNANFVLIKCESFKFKSELFNYLKGRNIYVRNLMQSPLLYNCLRITIGTKEQMQKVISEISSFISDKQPDNNSDKIALFDFCGTLVDFQSGNPYISFVVKNKNSVVLNFKDAIRELKLRTYRCFNKNYPDKKGYLMLLKGLDKKELERYAFDYYIREVRPRLYRNVIEKMQTLKSEGRRVYVVSAGYDIYLKYFVQEFCLDGLMATKIKFDDKDICLGRYDGRDCIGHEKVHVIKKYFKKEPFSTYNIVGFSDAPVDIPMLNLCQEKYIVTPNEQAWIQKNNYKMIKID